MQKQRNLSYIVSRVRKYDSNFEQKTLKAINKVLAVEPTKSNIPDILSIFTPGYKNQQEKLKCEFMDKCNRIRQGQGGHRIQFDVIYRDQKGQLVHPLPLINKQGQTVVGFIRFIPAEASKYYQTALSINQMKSQSLQQCLVRLLQVLQTYQKISVNKTISKHQTSKNTLNNSSLCEQANNRYENDGQNREKAAQSAKQTKQNRINETQYSMTKGQKQKVFQAEVVQQSQTLLNLKASEAQNVQLKARISHFQIQVTKLKEQHQKNRALWLSLEKQKSQISNQNFRISMNVRKLEKEKSELIQQKQALRKIIMEYKTKTHHFSQNQQVNKKEMSSKIQMIKQLQAAINADQTELKQIIAKQVQDQDNLNLRVATLQGTIVKKQQRIRQLMAQNQKLHNAVQNNQNGGSLILENTIDDPKKIIQRSQIQVEALRKLHTAQISKEESQLKQLSQKLSEQQTITKQNHLLKQDYQKKIQKINKLFQRSKNLILNLHKKIDENAQQLQFMQKNCSKLEGEKTQLCQQLNKQTQANKNLEQILKECLNKTKQLSQKIIDVPSILQKQIIVLKKETFQALQAKQVRFNQQRKQLNDKNKEREAKNDKIIKQKQTLTKQLQKKLTDANSELKKYKDLAVENKAQYQRLQQRLSQSSFKINQLNLKISITKPQKVISPAFESTVLRVSQILQSHHQKRQFLIRYIQKFTGSFLSKSQLKYKYDENMLNFSHYIKDDYPFLILFKLAQNSHIIGVFSTSISTVKSPLIGKTFLFTLQNGGKIFNKAQGGYEYGARFVDNILNFGSSQLYLKNNSSDKSFRLNARLVGSQYFKIQNAQSLIGFTNEGNQVAFEEMEVHRLYY